MSSAASGPLPAYYTALAPFRPVFGTGLPILTYHNLGPPPRGVRLKGLYLSVSLFREQLAELAAAHFRSTSLEAVLAPLPIPNRHFVLTFDDGTANALQHGMEPLAQGGFRAIQFLVAGLLGRTSEWQAREGEVVEPLMDDHQIRDWLAAGHAIGSHTLTHSWLTRLTPGEAQEEIVSSRKLLEDRFGVPVRHFCYPYGDWNPAVRDLVADAGYQTAVTTDAGINTEATPRFQLRRFTARYRSRNLKNLLRWLRPRRGSTPR